MESVGSFEAKTHLPRADGRADRTRIAALRFAARYRSLRPTRRRPTGLVGRGKRQRPLAYAMSGMFASTTKVRSITGTWCVPALSR
jgi:hypothetical protein